MEESFNPPSNHTTFSYNTLNNITLSQLDVIIGIWVPGLLCFFGILGNLVCLIVLQTHHRAAHGASTTFLSLKALAVSDLVLLTAAFFQQILPFICQHYQSTHPFCLQWTPYLKIYLWPVVCIGQMASVWTTVIVSGERYMAICSVSSPFMQVSKLFTYTHYNIQF